MGVSLPGNISHAEIFGHPQLDTDRVFDCKPIWSQTETGALASVIAEGLALFDFTPFKFEGSQRANCSK